MSFNLDCPFCGQRVEVPDELNNTTANCPACNQEVYLTGDDAVEELDPVVEKLRRESAAVDRARMNNLRDVMKLQEEQRRTHNIIKWIIYIFIVFPIAFWLLWLFIAFIYGCFSGGL